MSKYSLLIYSKNKKTINYFLNFFKNNEKQNFQVTTKKLRKKTFSVLKSPHVNKTAQEQFQYVYFCISVSFMTHQIKKKLFLMKKIKNQLFPDLKILIKGTYLNKKKYIELLYPNKILSYNQKLSRVTQKKFMKPTYRSLLKKSVFHLKTLDCYGKHK